MVIYDVTRYDSFAQVFSVTCGVVQFFILFYFLFIFICLFYVLFMINFALLHSCISPQFQVAPQIHQICQGIALFGSSCHVNAGWHGE